MDNLISVIVPIYNVEPYLKKCVDSIVNQTYKNLEIILVDDGSPDNCGAICDEYAEKDQRVRVIHKENGGLSDARNAGLAIANGDFLTFVDSDDWLPIDAIERLYVLLIKNNADIAIGDCARVDEAGVKTQNNSHLEEGVFTPEEVMKHVLTYSCAAWAQLYRRDVHINQKFPVGEINEDEAIVLKVLSKCKKVVITTDCVYFYRCRAESITTNAFSKKKLDWEKHCKDNWKFVKQNYPELEKYAAVRYRDSLLWSLTEIALCSKKVDYNTEIRDLMNELKQNKDCFLRIPFKYRSDYFRLCLLNICGFSLYSRVIRLIRRLKNVA